MVQLQHGVLLLDVGVVGMVPPWQVGMGAQVQLEGPGQAVLMRQVVVGVGHFGRYQQGVVVQALLLAQRLKALGAEHLAQGVWRVHRAVDDDVRDVDALARTLGVQ